ncbi:hypothetical protein BDDG_05811 [Blastomyces dermatitidis ATCC 18188]|uniref:Bacteriophage T5 Orf172 DNA-binding domain-containing protein n=1 Tax=Ajellomyces dermatitidis (strain ATCC 18188 / CBS 674.68) TaxID=653446 RepID=F2TI17_AJEDA|nr:hypothetical protein BDDG_05811 [Blastomyces dermatitidis ATCC 18188]
MSHPHNTPEYRLARTDSKNPATTCRGLRADGQKCRRTVVSAKLSPPPSPSKGVIAGKSEIGSITTAAFCWQHKDQEVHINSASTEPPKPASKLKLRSSIETLVERVQLLDVDDQRRPASAGNAFDTASARRKQQAPIRAELPLGGHTIQRRGTRRHSMDTPGVHVCQPADNAPLSSAQSRTHLLKYKLKSSSKSSVEGKIVRFIMGMGDDEEIVVSRVRHRRTASNNESGTSNISSRPPAVQPPFQSADTIHGRHSRPSRASNFHGSTQLSVSQPSTPERRPRTSAQFPSPSPARLRQPSLQSSPASTISETDALLRWIPSYLSPMTHSTLLKHLSEPISDSDEPGYIYMCWVTSHTQATSPPAAEIASSLLPTSLGNGIRRRNTGEIMRSAGVAPNKVQGSQETKATDTITLKIGRAANVHRRMNQWKEQCGHNLTLMRYYPYVPSSPSVHPGAPLPPRKVPHVHKVERLVHLELADRRVKLQEPCERCGKKHKEWFEIKADREQLRMVDACVKRWVEWSEHEARKSGRTGIEIK